MSRGNSDGSAPASEPAVMIVSPSLTRLVLADPVEDQRVAPPPCSSRPTAARFFRSTALTALVGSVISVTRDSPPKTFATVPTRPSVVTTTSSTCDSLVAPGRDADALVERRRAREHRPPTSSKSFGKLGPCRSGAACAAGRSPAARPSRHQCRRSWAFSARSFLFSDFASNRPRVQLAASRNGRVTRFGGDLERAQHRGRDALDGVERGRPERDGDQDQREQDQADHDDPALQRARASRGVAGGSGALDRGAQDRKTDVPVARHVRQESTHRSSALGY